jgi:hypothetical protein
MPHLSQGEAEREYAKGVAKLAALKAQGLYNER